MSKKKFEFSIAITVSCDATANNELAARALNDELAHMVRERFTGERIIATSFGTMAAPSTVTVADLVYTMQGRRVHLERLQREVQQLKAKPKRT